MKDQTDPAVRGNINPAENGTAILLVRQSDGSKRKEMHSLGSYLSFSQMADRPDVVACKWVPDRVMSFRALQASQCAGVACVDRCVHPGCMCDPDTNICV